MRTVSFVLAVTVLLAVASACSDDGGDDNATRSESEFQDQANKLCKDASEDDPIDLPGLIEELDALVPPESDQDDMSEMLTQFHDYRKALDKRGTPSTQTVHEADRLADGLGLSDCATVLDA
ncbi:MAG: hypothetical protein ACRDWD_09040 [Acidimicrobiia bacterium]